MAGKVPGPLGTDSNSPTIDPGTLARTSTPASGPTGVDAPKPVATGAAAASPAPVDPDIEALKLADTAKKAAYALKKAHPSVVFTSGKRSADDQARAMASNVVKNRKWIQETYAASDLRTKCQKWVDDHPEKKTQSEIAAGILSVFKTAADADLGKFSKHLSGEAFDVQPVQKDADAIKAAIRALQGLDKFLDSEGGLVRWHAQF